MQFLVNRVSMYDPVGFVFVFVLMSLNMAPCTLVVAA